MRGTTINYPLEGYFFMGTNIDGTTFSSDKNGGYGYRTLAEAVEAMAAYITEHKEEILRIQGPYVGVYD